MPKRTVLQSIIVVRDGKRVTIHPQKPPVAFDFTAEELEDIKKANPKAVRKPIDESATAESLPSKPASNAQPVPAANSSGVNSAQGAAALSNANKPADEKPATTSSDKPAVEL